MDEKTFDRIRKGGGRMVVGTPDDQSNVTALMPLGNSIYAVKEKGIYAIKLADEIDPARTNPAIPHVQQRVVALGSDSPLVGQTLLTAKELFTHKVLPDWFDCTQAILCSLEALKDLTAVCELKDLFISAEGDQIAAVSNQSEAKGSLILPAIGDVDARCKTFFQKADHASRSLLDIVKLFYKKLHGIRGMADLIQYAKEQYGDNDPIVTYLEGIAPTLKYVRDTRNCLEHPTPPAMQANISDFALRPDGIIARPSIEVIAGREHYPSADVSAVMTELSQTLPEIFEGVVASLCEKNIKPVGGFETFLIQIQPEHRGRGKQHVQFSYGLKMGDQIARLG